MKFSLILPALLALPLLRGDIVQGDPVPRGRLPAQPGKFANGQTVLAASAVEKAADISKYTNGLTLSAPDGAGNVAQIAARALERAHFSRMRFRDEVSAKLFERYLESLDPQRVYFLQGDYDEFAKYKTRLDDLTMIEKDVQPAYEIFNRFLQRFDQQYVHVTGLLKSEDFRFDSEERVQLNRKEEARPKDLAEARKLWRDRLRYEYLTEKLNQTAIPELSTNVWRKVAGVGSEQPLPETLPSSVKRPLGTNVLTDLEALVGKVHASETLAKVNDGKWTTRKEVETYLAGKLPEERRKDTLDKLARRYNRTLRTLKQYEPDEVLQLYLDSLAHSYDPHSNYFGKSELDSFSISMNLTLFGIGATLQSEDGYTVIRNVVPGSPAEKSKQIKVGDKIVAVAQGDDGEWVDVVDEKLKRVVEQIRGTKGTRVRLTTIPAGGDDSARKVVSLVRDEVKLEDSEAKAKIVELPTSAGKTQRVGVIDLPSFYASFPVGVAGQGTRKKSTTADVSKLIRKLQAEKVEGIILDLRRNGGGSLEEAVNLTGLFIKSGPVVQVKEFNGRVVQDDDEDPSVLYDGPLMVLTSRFSASASEIVAGALQDYGRAVVVGDVNTHGKGTVQTIQELGMILPDSPVHPGAVKLTIRKFYRASGESTQLKGVVPDVILPGVNNLLETGESSLTNALPWDTIASAEFDRLNRIQPYLGQLRDRSSNRIAGDRDWDYIRQDVEIYRKKLAEKTISLNYDQRVRERLDDRARGEVRKKELAARGQKEPTTYELTLKSAEEPGLPAPVGKTNAVAKANDPHSPGKTPAEGSKADPDDEGELENQPDQAVDVHLREAERILIDLIELSGGGIKKGVATSVTR
jgi:carboxyl-terminal processing protease